MMDFYGVSSSVSPSLHFNYSALQIFKILSRASILLSSAIHTVHAHYYVGVTYAIKLYDTDVGALIWSQVIRQKVSLCLETSIYCLFCLLHFHHPPTFFCLFFLHALIWSSSVVNYINYVFKWYLTFPLPTVLLSCLSHFSVVPLFPLLSAPSSHGILFLVFPTNYDLSTSLWFSFPLPLHLFLFLILFLFFRIFFSYTPIMVWYMTWSGPSAMATFLLLALMEHRRCNKEVMSTCSVR